MYLQSCPEFSAHDHYLRDPHHPRIMYVPGTVTPYFNIALTPPPAQDSIISSREQYRISLSVPMWAAEAVPKFAFDTYSLYQSKAVKQFLCRQFTGPSPFGHPKHFSLDPGDIVFFDQVEYRWGVLSAHVFNTEDWIVPWSVLNDYGKVTNSLKGFARCTFRKVPESRRIFQHPVYLHLVMKDPQSIDGLLLGGDAAQLPPPQDQQVSRTLR